MSNLESLAGVHPGPTGSLLRETYGIDNTDTSALFSDKGTLAYARALTDYKNAGVTIGSAPTYRLTNQRPKSLSASEWSHRAPVAFDANHKQWNRQAVSIAREVFSKNTTIVALLASIYDSAGKHDAAVRQLGNEAGAFALHRHRPQIDALLETGVKDFLVEAGRYPAEATALARYLSNNGAHRLLYSFEAPNGTIPDPESTRNFSQLKNDLHNASKGKLKEVYVGVNCTGATALRQAIENGNIPDVAYPNELDFARDQTPGLRSTFEELSEKGAKRTHEENDMLRHVQGRLTTPEHEFREILGICLQAGTRMVSVCCGGTPEHVRWAREVYDQHIQKASS